MIYIEKAEKLTPDIPDGLVEKAANFALEHESAPSAAELTIVLTDDDQLHSLNQQWMGVDAPTDVLSFPSDEIDPENGIRYLGDILVSVQRAAEQANAAGHSVESEIQLLIVHGVLHLLGHDHADAEEKARMWKSQAEILGKLGLGELEIRE